MPIKDLPDYTRQMVIKYDAGFTGLEELAVRLKSIVPWDLRGNVIFMEDFESEVTEWSLTPSGTGSSAVRTSEHKWSGDWSIKLVAGDEVGAFAGMERLFPGNEATKLALFARLYFDNTATKLFLSGGYTVGDIDYLFGLIYYPDTGILAYSDENSVEQVLASGLTLGTDVHFWPLLLVIDCNTGYYVKAIFGGQEYDMTTFKMDTADPTGYDPRGAVGVTADSVGAVGSTIYVDDIVVVKNVP